MAAPDHRFDEPAPLEVDVRVLSEKRQPPLPHILAAVGALAPGQALRVIAPFEPVPLYQLLGAQGFDHETAETGDGAWVVTFRRV